MKRRFSEEKKEKLQGRITEHREKVENLWAQRVDKAYKVLDARKLTKGRLGGYNRWLISLWCLLVLLLLILHGWMPALLFHVSFLFYPWFLTLLIQAEPRNRKWSEILQKLLAYPKFNLTEQEQEQFNAIIQRKLLYHNWQLIIIACASYPLFAIGYTLKEPLYLIISSVGVLFVQCVQNERWCSMTRFLLEQQKFELESHFQKSPPHRFALAVPRGILILLLFLYTLVVGGYGLLVSWDPWLPYVHRMLDESIATFHEPGYVAAVSFSKDGALLTSLSRNIVRLREVATGKEIAALHKELNENASSAVFRSPDGKFEASQSDSKIEVREADSGVEVANLFTSEVQVKSPDGKFSASVH